MARCIQITNRGTRCTRAAIERCALRCRLHTRGPKRHPMRATPMDVDVPDRWGTGGLRAAIEEAARKERERLRRQMEERRRAFYAETATKRAAARQKALMREYR
eukprot:jgi/Mesvir1/24179/Mv10896-RA.1